MESAKYINEIQILKIWVWYEENIEPGTTTCMMDHGDGGRCIEFKKEGPHTTVAQCICCIHHLIIYLVSGGKNSSTPVVQREY